MSSGIMREAMMHGMLVFIDDETLYCDHCGVVVPGGKTTHPPYCGERCALEDARLRPLSEDPARAIEQCIYCDQEIPVAEHVPAADDDTAWESLAQVGHASTCEWIETRAHRR